MIRSNKEELEKDNKVLVKICAVLPLILETWMIAIEMRRYYHLYSTSNYQAVVSTVIMTLIMLLVGFGWAPVSLYVSSLSNSDLVKICRSIFSCASVVAIIRVTKDLVEESVMLNSQCILSVVVAFGISMYLITSVMVSHQK